MFSVKATIGTKLLLDLIYFKNHFFYELTYIVRDIKREREREKERERGKEKEEKRG